MSRLWEFLRWEHMRDLGVPNRRCNTTLFLNGAVSSRVRDGWTVEGSLVLLWVNSRTTDAPPDPVGKRTVPNAADWGLFCSPMA